MDYTSELSRLLNESVKRECEKRMGVIFSAGVDSTLIATLASRHCDATAYIIGIGESQDIEYARKIEDKVDFRIKFIELSMEDVEKDLPRLVRTVGAPSPLKVGVGVPMHYTSKQAKADGLKVMLCGQGGDELFGGYWRYIELMVKEGKDAVVKMIERDIENADEDNLDRDRAVNKANGVELRLPYLGKDFMDYVEKIPFELKIKELSVGEKPEYSCVDELSERRFIRKFILRKLAEKEGVPKAVLDRGKKAAQYGSGSDKILEKLARLRGFKDTASKAGRSYYNTMYLESLV
ncbi:MAG: asparagine synthase-related protein [Candidatus Altiarchaeota archaeon]|nr:asparagine synthase-related protein [Candidatus Altiarchaeota archaeon]